MSSYVRLLLAFALLCTACTADLTPAWEVKEPRLMAGRVEIDGDTEGRTRPSVGESFQVRTFLASPTPPDALSFAVSLCVSIKLPTGENKCVLELALPDLDVTYTQGDDAVLRSSAFAFREEFVEAASQLGDLAGVSLFAAACVDGVAERVAETDATTDRFTDLFRCVDNDDSRYKAPLNFTFSIQFDLGGDGQQNRAPTFACTDEDGPCALGVPGTRGEGVPGAIVIERDEDDARDEPAQVWPETPADADYPAEGCADIEGLVSVFGADDYLIRVRFDAVDRERYVRTIRENDGEIMRPQREDLLLSHAFVEHGEDASLDAFSSLIDRETSDADAEAEIDYVPPKQSKDPKKLIPEGGKLVKFFFAVRDGRGGVDYTTRQLCVLPPREDKD